MTAVQQLTLDDALGTTPEPRPVHFDGVTYDPELDQSRLSRQLDQVRRLMGDGAWRTLAQISTHVGASEASVSARLRDLRKVQHGGRIVERRRVPGGNGLHEYRLMPVSEQQEDAA